MAEVQTLSSEMPVADSSPAESTTPDTSATTESSSGETLTPSSTVGDTGKSSGDTVVKTEEETPASGDDTRFDKHPRFQELRQKVYEAEQRAITAEARASAHEELVKTLSKGAPSGDKGKPTETEAAPARNYNKELRGLRKEFDDGDLSEEEYDSAKARLFKEELQSEFDSRLKQIQNQAQETVQSVLEKQQIEATRMKFMAEHPEYTEMQQTGRLESIKKSDQYGFDDDYSAYLKARLEDKNAEIETIKTTHAEEIKALEKTIEERVLANIKAKAGARTLGAGPSSPPEVTEENPAFKDPKKFGGATRVLAEHLAAMRRAV